jgi:branched-chain amino acid transport system permease protein
MMGLGGMPTFGHAAYFGIGAYCAALLFKSAGLGMAGALLAAPVAAAVAAAIFGWFCIRLTGVYLAMLTLAFAQIIWSIVYQWDDVTGGSNGIVGIWPEAWLAGDAYFYFSLLLVALAVLLLRHMAFAPFGYALRAVRDSALRADAIGIHVKGVQWAAFIVAGLFAGLAGALYVFSKGSTSTEVITEGKSVAGLVMVLLGGIQTLSGPLVGAVAFTALQDYFVGITEYWRALLGAVILLIVLVFPQGIAGSVQQLASRRGQP